MIYYTQCAFGDSCHNSANDDLTLTWICIGHHRITDSHNCACVVELFLSNRYILHSHVELCNRLDIVSSIFRCRYDVSLRIQSLVLRLVIDHIHTDGIIGITLDRLNLMKLRNNDRNNKLIDFANHAENEFCACDSSTISNLPLGIRAKYSNLAILEIQDKIVTLLLDAFQSEPQILNLHVKSVIQLTRCKQRTIVVVDGYLQLRRCIDRS